MKLRLWALNSPVLKNVGYLCLEHTVFSINGLQSINLQLPRLTSKCTISAKLQTEKLAVF